MLAEMVGAEELLRLVALSKLMDVIQVLRADVPLGWIRELLATVAARVHTIAIERSMERSFYARKSGTAPRMTPQMQGVLVSFSFILVLEAVRTVCAGVLLLRFVYPVIN